MVERAYRNLARHGPLTPLLDDDDVWEIMVNAPDAVFVRRHQGPSGYHDEVFHDDDHVVRTLPKLLDGASTAHRSLDPAEGLQDAQRDDGARVHIVHGDVARGGHVLVNIRRFTGIAFSSLDELVERLVAERDVRTAERRDDVDRVARLQQRDRPQDLQLGVHVQPVPALDLARRRPARRGQGRPAGSPAA